VEEWSDNHNARRVLVKAAAKVDGSKPGAVPPRVANEVSDKAQWAEDEFVAEYLSGVLASSRTEDAGDDRGVSWAALVGRLSSLSLRLHFVLYEAAGRVIAANLPERLENVNDFNIAINYEDLWRALGMELPEPPRMIQERRILEALGLLQREGLLHSRVWFGYTEFVAERYPASVKKLRSHAVPLPGIGGVLVYSVNTQGAELFMWGHGLADTRPAEWMNLVHEDPSLPRVEFPLLADDPDPRPKD
jgi:hypothetical protein